MKILKATLIILLVGLSLAACAQASLEPVSPTVNAVTPPVLTQTAASDQAGKTAVDASLALLIKLLNINVDQVKISAVEAVDWSNACLGVQKPGEMCAEVITPGFRITLETGDKSYEFHTNQDGSQIRMVDAPSPNSMPTASLPPAAKAAQQALAQQLGVMPDTVTVIRSEPVQWRDGCLGVNGPGRMCTQAITPGYLVILEVNGKQYEYHTNESGSSVIPAGVPQDSAQGPKALQNVIVWEQTEDNSCSHAEIGLQQVATGPCNGSMIKAVLEADRAEELRYFFNTYEPFTQDTPAGTVEFKGEGQKEPTSAEMRSVSEWARLVVMEAQGERSGADWRLVFTWHREGGFAGFCDDLAVDRAGWAAPTTCKVGQARAISRYRLTPGELEKFYTWLDLLASFDYEYKDAATADAMLVRVSFKGEGQQQATSLQEEEVASFGGQLYANAANK